MKRLILILATLALGFGAAAQSDKTGDGDEIYTVVEQDPEFDNGMEGLFQYLSSSINYPDEAKAKKIEGKVYVRFVIEKDGSVSDVQVVRSPDPILSAEAVRVVKAMPKWKAGRQNGKKVRVQYMLPINFQMKQE